jgi:hypothetical protein
MALEFPWIKKGAEEPGPTTRISLSLEEKKKLREEQINAMIRDAAVFMAEEESLGRSRKMNPLQPKDSYKFLLEIREGAARAKKEAEMAKKIKDDTEIMVGILQSFLDTQDKEVIARKFFSQDMTPEERMESFLKYYNENKAEAAQKITAKFERSEKKFGPNEEVVHIATLLLAKTKIPDVPDISIEEARSIIEAQIDSEPDVFEKIKVGLSKEDAESPEKLGRALLEYFKEKKRKMIAKAK